MTRKRFIKLVMSYLVQRNDAVEMTKEVGRAGSYKRLFLWFLLRRAWFEWSPPGGGAPVDVTAMAALMREANTGERHPDNDPAAGALYLFYEKTVEITGKRAELPEAFAALKDTVQGIASTIAGVFAKAYKALIAGVATANEARAAYGLPGISPLDTDMIMHHADGKAVVPLTRQEHANIHGGNASFAIGGPGIKSGSPVAVTPSAIINITAPSAGDTELIQRKVRRDMLDSLAYGMGGLQYGG